MSLSSQVSKVVLNLQRGTNMRSTILSLVLLSSALFAATDVEVKLSGKVTDASGIGMAGVTLSIKDASLSAITDASGNWSIVQETTTSLRASTLSSESIMMQHGAVQLNLAQPGLVDVRIYNLTGRLLRFAFAGNMRAGTHEVSLGEVPTGAWIVRVQAVGQGKSFRLVCTGNNCTAGTSELERSTNVLAKAEGDPDSLIVSYQGSEVGRMELTSLTAGTLSDIIVAKVLPMIKPNHVGVVLNTAPIYVLPGTVFQVNYFYDASIWLPTWLHVGSDSLAGAGKSYSISLKSPTDSVYLVLASRLQTIAFPVLADKTYGDALFTIHAQASSGLAVAYASITKNVCTVADSSVTIVRAGVCSLVASQAGDSIYHATDATQSFTVAPKGLTIANANADKVYDGTTTATITGATLVGVVAGDDVNLVVSAANFANANVGTGKVVTGVSLTGTTAGNYELINPGIIALVSPKIIQIVADAKSKTYGDSDPLLTYTVSGLLNGDALTGRLLRNAGTSVGTYAIRQGSLSANANYRVSFTEASLTISPKSVSVSGLTAKDKVFDGTTAAIVTGTASLTGVLDSDSVSFVMGISHFADMNAAAGKLVMMVGAHLAGASAGNYSLTDIPLMATITPAPLVFISAPPVMKMTKTGLAFAPALEVSASPAIPVSYSSLNPDVCTYKKGTAPSADSIVLSGTKGRCYIMASTGNSNYTSAYQGFGVNELYDSRDMQDYDVVTIGTQTWMARNLNYDTLDGTGSWPSGQSWPSGRYGRLYNKATALTVCPTGWHLPEYAEWKTLGLYVGENAQPKISISTSYMMVAGYHLKATTGWLSCAEQYAGNGVADAFGFSALPGGSFRESMYRYVDTLGYWWTSTITGEYSGASKISYSMLINYSAAYLKPQENDDSYGLSVRCLLDQ